MARVRTPLLSFGARGKLAKTLVYFPWKGIDAVREYVVPTNPRTAAQTSQRGYMTDVVAAWRNYFTAASGREAWDRAATQDSRPLSGFNLFTSNAVKLAPTDADASFANGAAAAAGNTVDIDMLNMDDGATGDEAGNFEVWVGDDPAALLLLESVAIAAGVVSTSDLGDEGDVKYVKLRKGGYDRSGIYKVTLIA